jgi:hypothetical protein
VEEEALVVLLAWKVVWGKMAVAAGESSDFDDKEFDLPPVRSVHLWE